MGPFGFEKKQAESKSQARRTSALKIWTSHRRWLKVKAHFYLKPFNIHFA